MSKNKFQQYDEEYLDNLRKREQNKKRRKEKLQKKNNMERLIEDERKDRN